MLKKAAQRQGNSHGMSAARPRVMRFVVGLTAVHSLIVGAIFLFGSSALLLRSADESLIIMAKSG